MSSAASFIVASDHVFEYQFFHHPAKSNYLQIENKIGIDVLQISISINDMKCTMLKVPTARTNYWKRSHKRGTATLVGPMFTPKECVTL